MSDLMEGPFSAACSCCQSGRVTREWGALSSFFAARALLRPPAAVALLRCDNCHSRYFDLAVTNSDLDRLYAGYRGDAYFQQRNGFEPWYSRAINDDIGGATKMRQRRAALAEALSKSGLPDAFESVLDHGGDRGQMLLDLKAPLKAVYEISGVVPDPGVTAIDHASMTAQSWDLILNCHVLEHLPDPGSQVAELWSLGRSGTVYFFEVPDEQFRSFGFNASQAQKRWISWLAKRPALFKLFDFVSTATRKMLRMTPPLLFVPLREHLTFFSVEGLRILLENKGLDVRFAEGLATGHIGVVAVKR